ncbi:DNA replication protein psf1 [Kappamyces sp. JEL0680]|nr:DNA replication protein psf1 [Kappamyces sp. JEL0680]
MHSSSSFRSSESLKLIHEAIRTRESPFIPPYRDDIVANTAGAMIKQLYIERAKRCVLAYQRERINRYIDLFWECGATSSTVLPEKSRLAASHAETALVKDYQELVTTWKGLWLDIDVGASIIPPKDVFIEIRVLQDCGEVIESGL